MTVYPSVWRESDCGAHFIVRRGEISVWRDNWWEAGASIDQQIVSTVLAALTPNPCHYFDLAQSIDEEPWDVLDACRWLVRDGKAMEQAGQTHGHFSRL